MTQPIDVDRTEPVGPVDLIEPNVRAVMKLQVADGQEKFVAPNAVSLAKAYVHLEHAWPGDVEVDDGEVVAVAPL